MRRFLPLTSIILCNLWPTLAQDQEAILPNGAKVLLKSDGTWIPKSDALPPATAREPIYRDEFAEIRFKYCPPNNTMKSKTGSPNHTVKVFVKNISKTKILKPDTHSEYPFDRNPPSPKVGYVYDNFKNQFKVSQISPNLDYRGEGLYPGTSKEFTISFSAKLIPSTEMLVFSIGKDDFGNSEFFDLNLPIRPGMPGAIREFGTTFPKK